MAMKEFALRGRALLIVFGAINDAPHRVMNYIFAARMLANAHSRPASPPHPHIVFCPAIENNL